MSPLMVDVPRPPGPFPTQFSVEEEYVALKPMAIVSRRRSLALLRSLMDASLRRHDKTTA